MSEEKKAKNFIEHIIDEDLTRGLSQDKLRFRFPPEPNGFLHIGHVKAICINFGLGLTYNAPVNLRFDDTNPAKEEQQFVDAIKNDITWLGYKWDQERYASDYFQQLYDWAVLLIEKGYAYVDSQSSEDIAIQKGTPTQVGKNSPFRNRSIEENIQLFAEMKAGKHPEGTHLLRAKGDMSSPNMLLRDPRDVSHFTQSSSPNRRRVVHLPDVRLDAWRIGLFRTNFPLLVFIRVQTSS